MAWVALVPLVWALDDGTTALRAFVLGVAGTLPFFVGVAYGLWPFNPALAVGFVVALATVAGAVCASSVVLRRRLESPTLRALVLPALWVLAEYGMTAAGIPWALAISQTENLTLAQSASLLGMSWISFVIVLTNVAVVDTLELMRHRRRAAPVAVVMAAASVGGSLIYGAWTLAHRDQAAGSLRVASIQPMLPSELYRYQWLRSDYRATVVSTVDALSEQAAASRPDLLVWPENGNGLANFRVPALRQAVTALAARSGATLLLSSYDVDETGRTYNAVFSVAPDGSLLGRYAKVRLALGGEEGFTAGTRIAPLDSPHGPIGALVCVESCLPWLARSLTQQGAVLLAVTTSDVAMRGSAPPLNHARFAVYRAIENRRAVVQVSNGGPSQLITPYGEVTRQTGFLARDTLVGTVDRMDAATIHTRFGDVPILAFALLIVGSSLVPMRAARPVDMGPAWSTVPGSVDGHATWSAVARSVDVRAAWWAVARSVGALSISAGAGMLVASASIWTIGSSLGRDSWSASAAAFLAPHEVPATADVPIPISTASATSGGVAALAYTMHVLGLDAHGPGLRAALESRAPSDASALASMAVAMGVRAWGESGTMATLRVAPKPVMAQGRDGRWCVVLSLADDRLDVFDPAVGYARVSKRAFESRWDGTMLVVRYASLADVAMRAAAASATSAPTTSRTETGDARTTVL